MATRSIFEQEPDVRATARSFQSIRSALIGFVTTRFPTVKIDWLSANYFVVFMEVIAWVGASLSYMVNQVAREAFLITARLPESILRHAFSYGFVPPAKTASTALVRVTLEAASSFDTVIPKGSSFFSTGGETTATFQNVEEVVIPAGAAGSFVDVWVEHSENFVAVFQGTGLPRQEFITSQRPVLRSGIDGDGNPVGELVSVTVGGVAFTPVSHFLDSTPTSAHVRIQNTSGGRLRLSLGDGLQGMIPVGDIVLEGRIGGGASGNNAVITRGPSLVNLGGLPVSATYLNSVVSSGGADGLSLNEIRQQAILQLGVNERTVGTQDFIINAESLPGIDRALAYTAVDDDTVDFNTTIVVPLTSSPANAELIGGNAAATSTTEDVDDSFNVSLHGETPQLVTLGTLATGEAIAAAIEEAVRQMNPQFPLDHEEAYNGFTCTYDDVNERYVLTSGQAGLDSSIDITAGPNDASVTLKLTVATRSFYTLGVQPSVGTIAALSAIYTDTKPVVSGHIFQIQTPDIHVINLDFEIRFNDAFDTPALRANVRDAIRTDLRRFFAPRNPDGTQNTQVDFGKTIRFSKLISSVDNVVLDGVGAVESVDEDSFLPADDVPVPLRSFPVLGGIVVRNKATGLPV